MSVLACGWGLICGVPGAGWGLAAGGGAPDGALEITAPGERGTGAGSPEVGGWAAVAGPGRAGWAGFGKTRRRRRGGRRGESKDTARGVGARAGPLVRAATRPPGSVVAVGLPAPVPPFFDQPAPPPSPPFLLPPPPPPPTPPAHPRPHPPQPAPRARVGGSRGSKGGKAGGAVRGGGAGDRVGPPIRGPSRQPRPQRRVSRGKSRGERGGERGGEGRGERGEGVYKPTKSAGTGIRGLCGTT